MFAASIKPGADAHIDYVIFKRDGVECMDLTHTFVPPSGRGMGLAARLCDAAFDFAANRNPPLKVIPSCTYISGRYLEKNPERRKACL